MGIFSYIFGRRITPISALEELSEHARTLLRGYHGSKEDLSDDRFILGVSCRVIAASHLLGARVRECLYEMRAYYKGYAQNDIHDFVMVEAIAYVHASLTIRGLSDEYTPFGSTKELIRHANYICSASAVKSIESVENVSKQSADLLTIRYPVYLAHLSNSYVEPTLLHDNIYEIICMHGATIMSSGNAFRIQMVIMSEVTEWMSNVTTLHADFKALIELES